MNDMKQTHFSLHRENEGFFDYYILAPGISISFNQIYTGSWTKGDSSLFSDRMLILNFCLHGRCDASLAGNRYAIVRENQVCVSTILPMKDFYYPGRLYEGFQIYLDLTTPELSTENSFLSLLGVHIDPILELFCGKNGLYLHRMSSSLLELSQEVWTQKDEPDYGLLRYYTVRLLHELMNLPSESETGICFTRSQIAIVKEAEALILNDLSKRITAKEMADRFGISESSFKLYVKGILGDSYLSYFRRKRMEKAANLLESTNLKVVEIAASVGYENQGKFARVFADEYGVSPLEFRRLSR